jgi:hypothetical protein
MPREIASTGPTQIGLRPGVVPLGRAHHESLLVGLGTAAAEAGYRVRYTLASKLVNELADAAHRIVSAHQARSRSWTCSPGSARQRVPAPGGG